MKEHRIHNYINVHRRVNGQRLRGNSGLINKQQQVRSNQTQTGINELMTGRTIYGRGNTRKRKTKSDIIPPPSQKARPAPYNIQRRGGERSGGLGFGSGFGLMFNG